MYDGIERVDNSQKTCGVNSTSTSIDVNHAMHNAIVQNRLKKNYHRRTPVERKTSAIAENSPRIKMKSNREEKIPRYDERKSDVNARDLIKKTSNPRTKENTAGKS